MSERTESKLLIVEDEESLREFLRAGLTERGFKVDLAVDGKEGLARAKAGKGRYAVYILDIVLPKMDGRDMVKTLRGAGDETPVLFLTAMDKIEDRVMGLEIGADDYVVKPFALEELVARLHALIRRSHIEGELSIKCGDLSVDRVERRVLYKGSRVDLTQREYQLLDYFIRHRGEVLSREQISRDVWGLTYTGESNFVDVYVRHLRQKIWDKEESQIRTVRGRGYLISEGTGDDSD
ncbi:MAG TPA: DNA-binding response regulator [Planctomycetes bacterium]|jgi:two-component system copper resistance phosphate regulon response regulator CusR|nr:DNA-binding response regulator [Planctomycetota bacterium]